MIVLLYQSFSWLPVTPSLDSHSTISVCGSLLVHIGCIGGNQGGKNLPNMIDTYNMYYVVGLTLALQSLEAVQLFLDIALQINRLKVVSWILRDYQSCNKSLLLSNINIFFKLLGEESSDGQNKPLGFNMFTIQGSQLRCTETT